MITVSKSLAIVTITALLIPISVFAEENASTTAAGTSRNTRPHDAGLRKVGSETTPLPKELEARLKNRDQRQDCTEGGSTTGCVGDKMQNREERRAEARTRVMEKHSEILKRISTLMFQRMEAAIERLTKLSDRVDSRTQKLKEQGIDTTKSEDLMKITRAKITEATVALEAAKEEVGGAMALADASASSTKPVDAGKSVRGSLEKARSAVMAAHKALVDAVKSLEASLALRENTLQKPGMLRTKGAPEGTSTQVDTRR